MNWPRLNSQKIKLRVFEALSANANYRSENILGLPGTYLDTEVFYEDAPFLTNAPFLSSLIANPNHIGCHTLETEGEQMFSGTQELEKDLIRIIAEEIFRAEPGAYDGYVASGGTEANIEALWIYRNYFTEQFSAAPREMLIVCSEDSHYSIRKAANLLNIDLLAIPVDQKSRQILLNELEHRLNTFIQQGKKYFLPVLNMGSTMFGSVDDIGKVTALFDLLHLKYKLHVDGAYGGFMYPFTKQDSRYHFGNPAVCSVSLDAHKLLQAPYGTGIFLIRKDHMKYVRTPEASYVKGSDFTLCGSRSGANAICIWMILHTHGSAGWTVKMNQLIDRAADICFVLDEMEIGYYREPHMNIISIRSEHIPQELAEKYYLVPDTHEGKASWYKIVLMPHIGQGLIDTFLNELSLSHLDKT